MKKHFTEQQIVAILKEGEAGVAVKEICRKHNISDATFYTWRKKYRGMETEGYSASEAARGGEPEA